MAKKVSSSKPAASKPAASKPAAKPAAKQSSGALFKSSSTSSATKSKSAASTAKTSAKAASAASSAAAKASNNKNNKSVKVKGNTVTIVKTSGAKVTKTYRANGNVKEKSVVKKDKNGNKVTTTTNYRKDGTKESKKISGKTENNEVKKTTVSYNKKGQIKKKETVEGKGDNQLRTTVKYKNGKKVSTTKEGLVDSENGKVQSKVVITYDKKTGKYNNQTITHVDPNTGETTTKTIQRTFNKKGKVKTRTVTDFDGTTTYKEFSNYKKTGKNKWSREGHVTVTDKDGNQTAEYNTQQNWQKFNGKSRMMNSTIVDMNGNLMQERNIERDNEGRRTKDTIVKYDSNGNVTETIKRTDFKHKSIGESYKEEKEYTDENGVRHQIETSNTKWFDTSVTSGEKKSWIEDIIDGITEAITPEPEQPPVDTTPEPEDTPEPQRTAPSFDIPSEYAGDDEFEKIAATLDIDTLLALDADNNGKIDGDELEKFSDAVETKREEGINTLITSLENCIKAGNDTFDVSSLNLTKGQIEDAIEQFNITNNASGKMATLDADGKTIKITDI